MFIIFFMVFAAAGVTYAWVSMTNPFNFFGNDGAYSMVDLTGELRTTPYEFVEDGIESGHRYEHLVEIENTMAYAGNDSTITDSGIDRYGTPPAVHLRAFVAWTWEKEGEKVQVAIPRDTVKVDLAEVGQEWKYQSNSGSWVRSELLSAGDVAKVTVGAIVDELPIGYSSEELDLKFRFIVEMEGEYVYRLYE
jgi:hypothetical protein